MPTPRVSALAVIRHPDTGALFVNEFQDPTDGVTFHRPCGGGVEWGELAAVAVAREFAEEFGIDVVVGRRIGVIENVFTYAGRPGHEVLFLFEARFADPAAYRVDRRECLDVPGEYALWRDPELTHEQVPLYPEGLADLLTSVRTGIPLR
jgi:ADP-ribose pyrophosphatase YjhB (NUDIX family)